MLLSQTEREWLLGNNKVSKGYERKIKSGIRKKIDNFKKFELPLLIQSGLITYPVVTESCNNVTKYSSGHNSLNKSVYDIIDDFPINSFKNFQYNSETFKYYGPDVIRTRDPRHVKAVS